MFTLPPQQIKERTRTPGGDRFTEFCDAIIRAHCGFCSVPDAVFRGNLRTNLQDGGVDTEVVQGVTVDTSGYMEHPTLWQFKAMDRQNAYPKMEEEVNKHEAKARIINGYAYRLCICDEIPAAEKATREEELATYVHTINPIAPAPQILDLYNLSVWAEQYLALVVRFRQDIGLRAIHIAAWQRNARAVIREYEPVNEWEPTWRRLDEHLDFSRTPPEVVLSLQGESGTGKTRLVYEVAAAHEGLRNLVVYTESEDDALELARVVANADTPAVRAIIIADECSVNSRLRLNQALRGCKDRVRVISIDNSGEKTPSGAPELWLGKMPRNVLEAMLKKNHPEVPSERRRAYVELSGGFAGLAADMCGTWDARIAAAGNVQPALSSIRDYFHTRVPFEEDRLSLMALSLVTKIGHADDIEEQLDALCDWIGPDISKEGIKTAAHRLHDNPGYVARGIAFFYVRPELIAQIAFEDAWQRWAQDDPEAFLKRLPPILTDTFEKRVARSAPEEVRVRVAAFFRSFVASLCASDLGKLSAASRFVRLIDTDPEQYLPVLHRMIFEASEDDLRGMEGDADRSGEWGPRRQIVWLLERLAAFPEFFYLAEEILLRLATFESEPTIANNATGIWRRFFQVGLSGTSIEFSRRLALLEQRLLANDDRTVMLAIGGLERSLQSRVTGMSGPAVVAGRIPPEDWWPKTNAESWEALDGAVNLLAASCASDRRLLRDLAYKLLLEEAFSLLQRKKFSEIRRAFESYEALVGVTTSSRVAICEKVRMYLYLEGNQIRKEHRPSLGSENVEAYASYIQSVEQWLREITPIDFRGRLLAAVGIPSWQRMDDQEKKDWQQELRVLAREILATPSLLSSEGAWLFSPEAQSSSVLGELLGRFDTDRMTLLDTIVQNSLNHKSASLARGYIVGLLSAESQAALVEHLNISIDLAESQDPAIAFELFAAGGRLTHAFERALRLIDAGRLAPEYLRAFAWAQEDVTLTGTEFVDALTRLVAAAEAGNARAGDAATELLWTRAEDSKRAKAALNLITAEQFNGITPPESASETFPFGAADLAWRVVESVAEQVNGMTEYKWGQIVRALADADPLRAVRSAALALVEDRHDKETQQILIDLAEDHPAQIMEEIGKLLLREDEVGVSLYIGSNKDLFGAIPDQILIDWLDRHGLAAARRVARQLAAPYIGQQHELIIPPVTEHLLRTYGDDKAVFNSFCDGVHSFQVYSGDIAGQHETEADAARPFLNHALPVIRKWAEREIQRQLEEAAWWRRNSEDDLD